MKLLNFFPAARNSDLSIVFSLGALACVQGSLCPASLPAQTLTFTGTTPYVKFGANLCRTGKAAPAPCSKTLTLSYKVTAGGTLGAALVLTLGSPGLDFTLANGSTCIGEVTTGDTCAVKVTFKPTYAGAVSGAVQLTSDSGTVLATTPILGTGSGPRMGTLTNGVTSQPPPGSLPQPPAPEIVIDGVGNTFGITTSGTGTYTLVEQPANGGAQITFPFTYSDGISNASINFQPRGMAIDGAGNIVFLGNSTVGVIASRGGAATALPFAPLVGITSALAIDGAGDVFVLVIGNNSQVLKLPAGCYSSACVVTVFETPYGDVGGIAADLPGDLFITQSPYTGPAVVTELPAGGGSPVTLPTTFFPGAVDGVGDFFAVGSLDGVTISLQELLEGHQAPVNLIPDFLYADPYNCNSSLALNLAGDAFAPYACENSGTGVVTLGEAVYLRSQFAPVNLGSIPVGGSAILPLGVTNTGNKTLSFTPYFVSPSYKILSATPSGCEAATAPGATCTLDIQFTALTAGHHNIELTLSGNAAEDKVILLEGMGTK